MVNCLAFAYAKFIAARTNKVGFMGLFTSGALWDYMHAYEEVLWNECLAIGREIGDALAIRPRAVSWYAQGALPIGN